MTQITNYKRSFSGSMGAGVKSLFGSTGRRFYELEHRTDSEKHRSGEVQKIIVDQIELGRSSQCAVRFGEDCMTVSRRHAAIVKDGNGWKLIQLSKTNSTYLNGHKVETEWYLQNGDEIQLSTGGPRIGFLVKEGSGSLVKSINLTARLSLFRQQALRPYKRALIILASVLAVVVLAGTAVIAMQGKKISDNSKLLAEATERNLQNEALLEEQQKILENQNGLLDSLKRIPPRVVVRERIVDAASGEGISACNPYVYHITVKWSLDGQEWNTLSYGTGFQLDDGKFVTARHVVSCYYTNFFGVRNGSIVYYTDNADLVKASMMFNVFQQLGRIRLKYECVSPKDSFTFTLDDVHDYGGGQDGVAYTDAADEAIIGIPAGTAVRFGATGDKDWAYVQRNVSEGLKAAKETSKSLKQGTQLYILGYPAGQGMGNPYLSTAVASQNGLNQEKGGVIMASNDNTVGGNSGGPILIKTDNGWEVVAILSGSNSDVEKGRFVPIAVIP